MTLTTKIDQHAWNQFVSVHAPVSGAFLHSWEWGSTQESLGKTIQRIGFGDEQGKLSAVALVIRHNLPGGMWYAYCPRGPIVSDALDAEQVIEFLKSHLKEQGALFFRVDPLAPLSGTATAPVQPTHTNMIDLSFSEEELRSAMHQKTRYNIRVATKKGVQVDLDAAPSEEVWNLFEQTASRGTFRLHQSEHYRTLLTCNGSDARVFLAVASVDGKVIGAAIMMDAFGTRTYLHGASSYQHRSLMAPYVLHWSLIQHAKQQGFARYDWWGVAPQGAASSHRWAGFSRFKRGFGGDEHQGFPTVDMVLRPLMYRLYQLVRALRRLR